MDELDRAANAIALLDNLTPDERLAVLQHYSDELADLTRESYLPGGGMSSGPMVVTETAPERETQAVTPPRSGATP